MSETNNIGNFGEYTGVPAEPVNNHPVLQQLKDKIAILESQLASAISREGEAKERLREQRSEMNDNEGKLQDILIEALSDEEIEQDVADKIAELYGLDLRKVFALNITVTLSVEVSAPIGTELSDIADNIGIGYGGITYSGVGELESDSWEMENWEEV